MADLTLQEVLEECKASAQTGYDIASGQYKLLHSTITKAEDKIERTLMDFNTSTCYLSDATSSLSQQLAETRSALDGLSFAFRDGLQNLKENLGKFSITLFGRTMVGKSTLMEILTHGDGSSIGHGGQRTTQDVRSYHCDEFGENLTITDVPGIGAFGGKEDEFIAFDAAQRADMILFLVSDNGPQAAEADCLEQILRLGKPVVCIINVRSSLKNKSIQSALRDIDKKFDYNRLNAIRDQFCAYAPKAGQNWRNLSFAYVHLLSAFQAQQTSDQTISECLHKASRIDALIDLIIQHVKTRGKFYRVKNFIDIIANPMINSMENLLQQCLINSAQGRIILAKKRKLEKWQENFEETAQSRINSCVTQIKSELNNEIASFAEDHFSDKDAEKSWRSLIQKRGVQEKCQEAMKDLEEQCNEEIKEISREITSELNYTVASIEKKRLHIGHIVDGKKIWNWSATIIGGGLSIGTIIASLTGAAIAGPLGWAAFIVGAVGALGSFLFKSRNKKEQEARIRMENSLKEYVNSLCESLQKQMEKNLSLLIQVRIIDTAKEMTRIISVLFRLANTQKELAWYIDNNLLILNQHFLKQAIHLISADGLEYHVQSVGRIPGTTMTLLLRDNIVFPKEQIRELINLTGESIVSVYDSNSKEVLISRILGNKDDWEGVRLEKKIGVAHVRFNDKDPLQVDRVRKAQQLSQMVITK